MRRFIIQATIFALPIIIVLVGISAYFYLVLKPNQGGDLATLGGYATIGSKQHRSELVERGRTEKYAVQLYGEPEEATIVNIGDSFTNVTTPNQLDYIVSATDMQIYNIEPIAQEPFELAISLLNDGYFDRLSTKVVILESVERSIYDRLSIVNIESTFISPKNSEQMTPVVEVEAVAAAPEAAPQPKPTQPKFKFSAAEVYNWILLLTKDKPVISLKLNKPQFTIGDQTLHIYQDDIRRLSLNDDELALAQQKLNQMYDLFASKGIKLIVLCPQNKLTAYQDYIINNPYPRSQVAEQISQLNLIGTFISSVPIIKKLIDNGTQDVYFVDDTHWTPIAAEAFAEVIIPFI